MAKIRIVLVDDHSLVRVGLRTLAKQIDNIDVVGEAGDGLSGFRLIKSLKPDVVLMDISMKELNGLDTLVRIQRDFPEVRVIMLSAHANEEYVHRALQDGAIGYVLKDAGLDELRLAIEAAMRGVVFLSPALRTPAIHECSTLTDGSEGPLAVLTARQREILQLLAEGRSTKEMASRLHISIKTVETHRLHLMNRLEIHDVPGLVRFAIRTGIVTDA